MDTRSSESQVVGSVRERDVVPGCSALSLLEALESVPDHRSSQGRRYPLSVLLVMALSAMLAGSRSLYAIAQWSKAHRSMLVRAFDGRVRSTPGVATLHRVFTNLDVEAFERVLHEWLSARFVAPDEALALDGKALCGIHGERIAGVHLVAAFSHRSGVVVSQAAVCGKGQELAAGREVLAKLPIEGRVLTLDALYATRDFCREVEEKGGDTSSG